MRFKGSIAKALADAQTRQATFQRRLAPGFLSGRTNVASPVSPTSRGIATPQTRPGGVAGGASSIRVSNPTLYEELNAGVVGQDAYRVQWSDIDEQHGSDLSLTTPNVIVATAGPYSITGTAALFGTGALEVGIELDGALQSPGLTNRGTNNRATAVIAGVYLDVGTTISVLARNMSGAGLWDVFEPELLVVGPL